MLQKSYNKPLFEINLNKNIHFNPTGGGNYSKKMIFNLKFLHFYVTFK